MDAREQPCAFCEIVAGSARARVVYEDAHTLAFFPLASAAHGHTLVVPRTHTADLWAMEEAAVHHLFRTVLSVGNALRAVLEPEGMNVISSAGEVATQSVFHTHVHLVPRRPGDAMGPIWPPGDAGSREEDDTAADALAARLWAELTGR